MGQTYTITWTPLESNPDVMNKCLKELGVPEEWGISDVISVEEEHLKRVPTPCLAILMLFPVGLNENVVKESEKVEVRHAYFLKQTVENACGPIALIHAVANNEDRLNLSPNSVIKRFLDATRDLSPEERGNQLGKNLEIADAHGASTSTQTIVSTLVNTIVGQTETSVVDDNDDVGDRHFIALVKVDGKLVEFDGLKSGPAVHGSVTDEHFVQGAFRVCRSIMARNPSVNQFTVLSFGATKKM